MESDKFHIIFSKEAAAFLSELDQKVRSKILYNIGRVAQGEKNKVLFSKLSGSNIWEFRTLYGKMIYRLLAFWDVEAKSIIVATNGFVKKSQKTPTKEIERAEKIRKRYYDLKRE